MGASFRTFILQICIGFVTFRSRFSVNGLPATSCLICNSITYVPIRQLDVTYMGAHESRYLQSAVDVDVLGNTSSSEPVTIVVHLGKSAQVLTVAHNVLIGDTVVIFGTPTILPAAITVYIGSQSGIVVDEAIAGNTIEPSDLLSTVYFQTGCSQPLSMGDQFGSIFIHGFHDRSIRGEIHSNATCILSPWYTAVNTIAANTTEEAPSPESTSTETNETITTEMLIYMAIGVGVCLCVGVAYIAMQNSKWKTDDDASPQPPPVPPKRKKSNASINSLEWDMAVGAGNASKGITYAAHLFGSPRGSGQDNATSSPVNDVRPVLTPDQRGRLVSDEGVRGALPTVRGDEENDNDVNYRTERRRNAYVPSHLFSPQETEDLDIDHELMLHLTGASRRVRHPPAAAANQNVLYSVPKPARKSKSAISPEALTTDALQLRVNELKQSTTRTYASIKSVSVGVEEVTYDRVRFDDDGAADTVSESGYSRISDLRSPRGVKSPLRGDGDSVHYEEPVTLQRDADAAAVEDESRSSEITYSVPSDTLLHSIGRSAASVGTNYLLVPDTVTAVERQGLCPLSEGCDAAPHSSAASCPPPALQPRRTEPVYAQSLKGKSHSPLFDRITPESPSYIRSPPPSHEGDEPLYCVTEDLLSSADVANAMLGTKRRSDGTDAVVSGRGHEVECAAFEPREPTYAVADKNRKSQLSNCEVVPQRRESDYDLAAASPPRAGND